MQAVLGTTVEKISSNKSGYSGDTDIGEPILRRYIGTMIAKGKSQRLIEALLLSALAGSIAYGVTVWLAPDGASALWVALIVAAISVLAVLMPSALIESFGPSNKSHHSDAVDSYHSLEYRLTNHTGIEASEYSPEEEDLDRT